MNTLILICLGCFAALVAAKAVRAAFYLAATVGAVLFGLYLIGAVVAALTGN